MNIFVILKQVPDTETKIRLTADSSNIEKGDIKWIINPYDEFAIEEALKTKEKFKEGTVTVLTAGPDRCAEALRTAIAMGADNAVHIKADIADTYIIGRALTEALKKEGAQVVFSGKQAIDDDQCATFGYVAEYLNWPSASVIVKVEFAADKKSVKVEREAEGGERHVIEMPVPCLIAVNKGLNTPRYASLPGIMKAKKKEIKAYTLADLGLGSETAALKESAYQLPPERSAGKKLAGDAAAQVKDLVRMLREEAKVI